MFSGIIETIGSLEGNVPVGGGSLLTVATAYKDLAMGESIAVNGVCLTVAGHVSAEEIVFFVSAETLARSNIGQLREGAIVNLERSVALGARLCGHLVQGHVDARASIVAIETQGDAKLLCCSLPEALRPYCVEKGSIALNGISLTLNSVGVPAGGGDFPVCVTIIPYTWEHTNLRHCAAGNELNVEVDVLAKYVEQLCQPYLKQ